MRALGASRTSVVPGGVLAGPWVRNELWRRARAVPSLDLRFADNKNLTDAVTGASLITFTRASSGTFVDSAGEIQTATTDVPRFDHNPTTGESLGLLVEEARTNSIRNNTNVGAVAGTPGTLPTNWSIGGSGLGTLTRQIVGVGTENGISYIDIRISGTSSTTDFTIPPEVATQIAAATGQSWTYSQWIAVVGGSTANIGTIRFNIMERTSAGGSIQQQNGSNLIPSLSSSFSRYNSVFTLSGGATTAFVEPRFNFTLSSGVAIDITLRIGLPQLEQGAFTTSVIPTSGTAATRSADVANITGANFGTTRTNLLLQSNGFDTTWTNTESVETANQTIAPDDTNSGWKLVNTAVSQNHNIIQSVNWTAAATTVSVFVKYLDHRWVGIRMGAAGNQFFGSWDLQNSVVGSVTAGATIGMQAFGNGWYRLTLSATLTSAGGANLIIGLNNADAVALTTYTGTGTGIYLYGAQVEAGSAATPYIPTTTAAVSVFESSWYRQDEGTVFVNAINPAVSTTLYAASDGTTNNRIQADTGTNTRIARVVTGGTTQANNFIAYTFGAQQQFALSYVLNSINFANAGTLGTEDTSATIPTVDQLRIGANPTGANALNSTIRRLTYWPTRLANNTLQEMTR